MTLTLSRPVEAHLTNGTKRSRAVRVAGPGPAVREFISARQQMQSARAHAEAWYQALRHQDTRENGGMLVVGSGPARASGRQMIPVVGNWNAAPAGVTRYTEIKTPLGWLSERAVQEAMKKAEDPMLGPIQRGMGLASLADERGGWSPHRQQAMAYAVAVLTVAQLLGDPQAATHLLSLQKSND
ncbi:hypothetical protein [Deinococcus aquatilis]|uniref:hypothetical protein n=1 Tax=Deinococcus aquatilis TaxID=519440 RepID=UPI00035D7CD0|nr:hypothetical protein [Deinococcus aquatilis]